MENTRVSYQTERKLAFEHYTGGSDLQVMPLKLMPFIPGSLRPKL